jgi:hypothetical protein
MKMTREKGDVEGRGCRVRYGVGEMLSFVCFVCFIALRRKYRRSKEENKGGEEWRKEGNPARWPLSKTGLLADTSRYGPQIQKKNGRTDPINRRIVEKTNVMFSLFYICS